MVLWTFWRGISTKVRERTPEWAVTWVVVRVYRVASQRATWRMRLRVNALARRMRRMGQALGDQALSSGLNHQPAAMAVRRKSQVGKGATTTHRGEGRMERRGWSWGSTRG